ncbi:unnamed protein product [Mytilus coruscus]|uniref:Uncharacterized protein n=1 Tax=Mytilus coruscus TaxID=42192 RepID=A0A6J8AWR2_MYTCO|nr:unnamed protein product [Mytilus coruscus]
MRCLSQSYILLFISAALILIAVSVASGTLAKSVKWTFYNEAIDYGYGYILYMYAYQNLWTSYDIWKKRDQVYTKVFIPTEFRDDSWRLIPRLLILTAVGLGLLSFIILLVGSLVPVFNRKQVILNAWRIGSSVISLCAGGLLVSCLIYYKKHYQSILSVLFNNPANQYPDKENISVGFYLTAFASVLFFASSIINIVNVVILIKSSKASVQPSQGLQETKEKTTSQTIDLPSFNMRCLSQPYVLLLISAALILIAVSVASATLAKSVKWTFYNEAIDYGYGYILYMYAYQNLWTSYDVWKKGDSVYTKVFVPTEFRDDSWRLVPRLLILTAVGLGAVSFIILLLGSLVPIFNRKPVVLNAFRIASSAISFCAGGLLVSCLIYYKKHYQSILSVLFKDPASQYPDKENISVGFYLTAFASVLFFASSIINIVNVVILIKSSKASVKPSQGLQKI